MELLLDYLLAAALLLLQNLLTAKTKGIFPWILPVGLLIAQMYYWFFLYPYDCFFFGSSGGSLFLLGIFWVDQVIRVQKNKRKTSPK